MSKIFTFDQQLYNVPSINPVLKNFGEYSYYVPNNSDGEIYQTFMEIQYLYDNCPLHSSILNTLIQEIYGSGLVPSNDLDLAIIKKYKNNKLLLKVIYDFVLFGGSYVEIIWNEDHTKILEYKHIPYNQIRLGKFSKDSNDEIEIFYHCRNWATWKEKEIIPLSRFNPNPNFGTHQILPIFFNEFKIYPIPYYYALFNDIRTMISLSTFYRNYIENNFSVDRIITVPGIMEQEQEDQLRIMFDKNFKGVNGLKTIIFNPARAEMKPIIDNLTPSGEENKYNEWNTLMENKIVQGHGLPNPMLAGIKTTGELGGSGEELLQSYNIYKVRKIQPMRNYILEAFEEINTFSINPLSQIEIEDLQIIQIEKNTNTDGTI